MAFKIVYKRKIHKLPLHVCSVAAIKSAVEKLYPQIEPGYHIFFFFNQEPLEIIHEDALYILLKILQLTTVKLFIFEGSANQVSTDDIKFMEQSSIYSNSVIQIDQSLKQPNIQQSPYQNLFQSNQQAQQQLQQQQPIVPFPQKQQYPPNTQNFSQYQYPPMEPEHEAAYSFEVVLNYQTQSFPDQEFMWTLALKNSGHKTWPQTMKIRCIDGPYKGHQQLLPEAIPGQTVEAQIKLKAPLKVDSIFINWGLYYLENAKESALPQTICLYLEVIKEVPEQRFQGTLILTKAEQVKMIMNDQSINFLCKFIEKNRLVQWRIEDIINKIYDGQLKK